MAISPPSATRLPARTPAPFFQPPTSPAPRQTSPLVAAASHHFGPSAGSRKRQRPDSLHSRAPQHATQTHSTWAQTGSWAQCPTPRHGLYEGGLGQNSVNERYRLAGGFDTPSLRAVSPHHHPTANEHEFRRRLRDDDMDLFTSTDCAPLSGPLARERNGVARLGAVPDLPSHTTWTQFAFGLVGKVFSLGTNVFKGFYSGGGKGYEMSTSAASDRLQRSSPGLLTPLPASWQEDEFLGDYEQDSPYFNKQALPASPTRPAAKRRQTDRDSWILVDDPHAGTPLSPRRKSSACSVPRLGLVPARPSASRASSRRSLAPAFRKSSPGKAHIGSSALSTHVAPPVQQPRDRRASVALTRSPPARPRSAGHAGYVTPEAERFAKRQAKQERAADKAMNNMGHRIREMMRQAQEALGTQYSVEGDAELDDEGACG